RVRERRDLGLEQTRVLVAVVHGLLQLPLDGGSPRGDLGNVPGPDRLHEERAVRDPDAGLVLRRARGRPVVEAEQDHREQDEPPPEPRPVRLLRGASAGRVDPPTWVLRRLLRRARALLRVDAHSPKYARESRPTRVAPESRPCSTPEPGRSRASRSGAASARSVPRSR